MRFMIGMLVGVMVVSVGAAEGAVMRQGRWEVTMRTERVVAAGPAGTADLPRAPQPAVIVSEPSVTVVCVTKTKAERPEPPKGKPTDDCKVTTGGLTGNVLRWTTACTSKAVSSSAEFTYSNDSYQGVVTIAGPDGEVRQIYSGRYLGPCDAGTDEEAEKP